MNESHNLQYESELMSESHGSLARGLIYGCLFSIPLDIAIGWAVWAIVQAVR